jgi:glycosyltransferase involved in cell wall biosynthesis
MDRIERQISLWGLEDHAIVHGARTRAEVARIVSRCDAAVLASSPTRDGSCEGIPVALMEAMSAGLPVVATRIGGIPELVEDGSTGYLVPPSDSAALAAALERLAQDRSLRESMGRAGREKVLREFSQEQCVGELANLIRRGGRSVPLVEPTMASPWLPDPASQGPLRG